MAESKINGSFLLVNGERVFPSPSLPTQGQSTPDPDATDRGGLGVGQNAQISLNWSDDDIIYSNTTTDGVTIEDKTQDSSINDFLYQGSSKNSRRQPLPGNGNTTNQSTERLTSETTTAVAEDFGMYHGEPRKPFYMIQSKDGVTDGSPGETRSKQTCSGATDDENREEKTKESLEGELSDGYFDQSIDKIYERYNKSKPGTIDNTTSGLQSLPTDSNYSSQHTPTGCFDNTRDNYEDQNCQQPFYKR